MSNINEMEKWYQTNLGLALAKCEINGLENIIPKIFGYFFLQLGGAEKENYLRGSLVHNIIQIRPEKTAEPQANFIQSNYNELPFASSSIDAVLISHILESAANPREILAEIYDTLVPEGQVIIFCFNPCSLWGIYKMLTRKNPTFPWKGKYISPKKLRKILVDIGFTVGDYKSFFFRPPLQNQKILKRLVFFEMLGAIFWPYLGASYMFLAKKVVTTLTPVRLRAIKQRKLVVADSWVKPSSSRTTNCIATDHQNRRLTTTSDTH